MRSLIVASELLEGPSVHTIFALREHPATIGSKRLGLLIKILPLMVLSNAFRIKLGVELRAQQDDDRKNIEPYEQCDGRTK